MYYYINNSPDENGNYGNPRSTGDGLALSDEFLESYIDTMGFAILTVENDNVTAVEVNQEALDAYLEEYPVVPTENEPTVDDVLDVLLGVNE